MFIREFYINFTITKEEVEFDYLSGVKQIRSMEKKIINESFNKIYDISKKFEVPIVIFPVMIECKENNDTYTLTFILIFKVGILTDKNFVQDNISIVTNEINRIFEMQKTKVNLKRYEEKVEEDILNKRVFDKVLGNLKHKSKKRNLENNIKETDFFD